MSSRVIIVGSASLESLESSYARAFRQLDWAVDFWSPWDALYRVARGRRLGRLFSTFVQVEPWWRKANLELLRLANEIRPTLILVVSTHGVRAGTLAQLKVRVPEARLYCLYPDSPHNLDNDRIHCLPFFDRCLTSSPLWVEAFQRLGAANVNYLPFAADVELHQPVPAVPLNPELAHAVSFIGTWRPEREAFLEKLADLDLRIWGSNYWRRRTRPHSPLRPKWGGRSIIGAEFAQVCAQSKIMLNMLDPATWPGPNMRAFELPACGAFALTERSDAMLDIFTEGKTIECFSSVQEARDKVAYFSRHNLERRQIAEASYTFVTHQGHTYHDRARQLIKWVAEDRHNYAGPQKAAS